MVNAAAFVLSGVYMVAKLRSSDTGGNNVLTWFPIFLFCLAVELEPSRFSSHVP